MQNKKQKTESGICEKYTKYEYKKSSYAEKNGVLQSFRQDGSFCDIKLKTDDNKIITANKAVLASASPYFHAMFTNFSEKNHDIIVMREIDSTALQLLVNFVYSGRIVITEENVQVLLPASNLLQLQEIKEVCCDFLQSQLCPTNCIGIYAISDLHSCTKLFTCSELYIQQHFTEVAGGEEFLSLSLAQVIQLISSDKLTVPSEEKVFESVICWVKYESSSRKCILPQLMEHVRLPLISKDFILKEVVEEPLIKNCYKCKDYINEALNFHRLKSKDLIPNNIRNNPRHGDKVILVVSRFDTHESTKCISTKFYEPKINRWHNGPEMITNHKNAGLAVVKDDSLFTVGGFTDVFHHPQFVDVLDLSSKSRRWKSNDKRIKNHKNAGLAVMKDDLVFAVGGFTDVFHQLQSVDVLDLSSESPCWKSSVEMLVKRNILGVGVINNYLYAVGGHNISDGPLDSAEVFDYNTQEWSMINNMSSRRSGLGVGVLNNLLYAVGGSVSSSRQLKTVECYDPSLDTWTPVAKMSVRRKCVGVGVLDGLLYVFGGSDNEDSTECYSPKTNTWTIVAPLKIHRNARARVVAINRPRHLKTC